MGHARFTKDIDAVWEKLKKEIPDIKISEKTTWFNVPKNGNVFNFEKAAGIYTSLIDDFFDEKLTWDYYKEKSGEPQSKVSKKGLTEKLHQQMLFSKYFRYDKDNKYLFLDMEYAIPRKNKSEPNYGSPDCIALKMDNGMPAAIMLVEVKSTKAACTGKSGIDMHPKS